MGVLRLKYSEGGRVPRRRKTRCVMIVGAIFGSPKATRGRCCNFSCVVGMETLRRGLVESREELLGFD